MFAVLPPVPLNFMLAERYQIEPRKVASIVLLGNAASLCCAAGGAVLSVVGPVSAPYSPMVAVSDHDRSDRHVRMAGLCWWYRRPDLVDHIIPDVTLPIR